ncbi:hypothetical protein O181_023362 [Austropuccinia psidii MF-1]|uniref:Uncharacterized protein n=1 Tax=Austropuccinia psidii MF-1 TaxID=1389203 RepID=A0A9Q3CJD7_9BASI|nr:hypothetical protein [Austropuccinia psidii MF-1]
MEGAEPCRRGGVKSRRSRSFSGLLGGYPGISEGTRCRLGEADNEEGEDSVEEEESEETEVASSLEGTPEAPQVPNIALSNQPFVFKAEPNFLNMMEQMTHFMGQLTQEVTPRDS